MCWVDGIRKPNKGKKAKTAGVTPRFCYTKVK